MDDFDIFGLVDFASFENARLVARRIYADDLGGSGSSIWVSLLIRGVAVQYDVAGDFAYCDAPVYDRFGTDLADWVHEDDRVVWVGK